MAAKPKKILAIDDEPDILEMIGESLEAEGYEVRIAYNGKSGLEVAREFKPDLIFLDVMMPIMSGFQFLEGLGAYPEISRTPVVMLSAFGAVDNIFKAQAHRVRDFLMKPYKMEDLIGAVHRYT